MWLECVFDVFSCSGEAVGGALGTGRESGGDLSPPEGNQAGWKIPGHKP